MRFVPVFFVASIIAGCSSASFPTESVVSFQSARDAHRSIYQNAAPPTPFSAPLPPPALFSRIQYPSPAGNLAAYVTPDPGDGLRHPAVVWAHGGFGGIDTYFWEPATPDNDQSAQAFRNHGIVLMCPSWRGENSNPGRQELFLGEVDDLIAAMEYTAGLPYVDPDRVYLAGHSTGGTLVLLAAVSGARFRAAFAFGGAPDVYRVVRDGEGYGNTPFDYRNAQESYVRSAIHFTRYIQQPTFYFEGLPSLYARDARKMASIAHKHGVPFHAFLLENGDHFSILAPITELIARKIIEDTGPTCDIAFTAAELP